MQVGEYRARILQLVTALGDHSARRSLPASWPASLARYCTTLLCVVLYWASQLEPCCGERRQQPHAQSGGSLRHSGLYSRLPHRGLHNKRLIECGVGQNFVNFIEIAGAMKICIRTKKTVLCEVHDIVCCRTGRGKCPEV